MTEPMEAKRPTMRHRWSAFRSLRLNYRWRGVYRWLIGVHKGKGVRGWRLIWTDPQRVEQEQHAIAEGVFL